MDGVSKFKEFLHLHKAQLVGSGVPETFWHSLYLKLTHQTFDAGNAFSLLMIEYEEGERDAEDPLWTVVVAKESGIKANDKQEIYLIDHAWTYRLQMARNQLRQVPQLLNRMSIIMGHSNIEDQEQQIEAVMESMWQYNQMYTIGGGDSSNVAIEDRMPIWYIMDELGSGVNHSDGPNCRIVPFLHMAEGITYSLLFPIKDCEEGERITRDFVEGTPLGSLDRKVLLLPWRSSRFTDIEYVQSEPGTDYFLSGRIEESLPDEKAPEPQIDTSRPLKVYSTYSLINEFLNDSAFEIVYNELDADILWLTSHFKAYEEFSQQSPNKFVNQFPFENVLTIKDLLAIVCRRMVDKYCDADTLNTFPSWLPTTFNLNYESAQFVSYYQAREKKNLDNHWIVKPWNLARGLDIYITKNLTQIVRLKQTGPKIVQKYVDRPVLFHRNDVGGKVKFDVRYVILLKSVAPLDAYIYRNFFLRFANTAWTLADFDNYEKHFTVMNYNESVQLHHVPCAEFLEMWREQYAKNDWSDIETSICKMLGEVLVCATQKATPCGIGKSPQSRALYAADIMLEWSDEQETLVQPKLLEINWIPDCKRACDYYPQFFNDIFQLLFLNKENDNVFRRIPTN